MPAYPGEEREERIALERLTELVAEIFRKCGMEGADAALVADSLAVADLRGVHSHGVLRVPEYVRKLLEGGVNPGGRPTVVKDSVAALVVDSDNSMGQVGSAFAMWRAVERARQTGVAAAAVRGSNHCGAMFYYAMQALPHDMIGIATTNALPTMAPWGGVDKIVGINPLAAAIPTLEEPPIVLDAAFSYASHGKIRVYHQKGHPIPPTWAFDRHGRPTTDTSEALEGLLQPIGEYKGVGFAIVMGILSALLSGASYGTELGDMAGGPRAGADGHFYMAVNIAAFEDPQRFKERADRVVRQVRDSQRAEGVERLYAPGGLEAETEDRYRREGIPLNEETLMALRAVAEELGVKWPEDRGAPGSGF